MTQSGSKSPNDLGLLCAAKAQLQACKATTQAQATHCQIAHPRRLPALLGSLFPQVWSNAAPPFETLLTLADHTPLIVELLQLLAFIFVEPIDERSGHQPLPSLFRYMNDINSSESYSSGCTVANAPALRSAISMTTRVTCDACPVQVQTGQ